MYDKLVFDITPENKIYVCMTFSQDMYNQLGQKSLLAMTFDFLALEPRTVTATIQDKNRKVTISWLIPISLAEFLTEKFAQTPNVDIYVLNRYLEVVLSIYRAMARS